MVLEAHFENHCPRVSVADWGFFVGTYETPLEAPRNNWDAL